MRKGMKGHGHWVRIENSLEVGTPDVNGAYTIDGEKVDVWIELKSRDEFPVRELTPIRLPHFTTDQRDWLIHRERAGGRAFLLVRVAREYFLFNAIDAYNIDKHPRHEWYKKATAHYRTRIDWDDLRRRICHYDSPLAKKLQSGEDARAGHRRK